jgi:hypothetical protein
MRKLMLLSLALVASLGAIAIWARPVHDEGQNSAFSNSRLSGTYIFHFRGSSGAQLQIPGGGGVRGVDCGQPSPCLVPVPSFFPALQRIGITGTFVADGAGGIPSLSARATLEEYRTPDGGLSYHAVEGSCDVSLIPETTTPPTTGYSVNPDGSGTLTLFIQGNGTGSNPCQFQVTAVFDIQLADIDKGTASTGLAELHAPIPNPGGAAPTRISGSFARR